MKVRIPPPEVPTESVISSAGLYRVLDTDRYVLYTHDHDLGRLRLNGWVKVSSYPSDASKRAFLTRWMHDCHVGILPDGAACPACGVKDPLECGCTQEERRAAHAQGH